MLQFFTNEKIGIEDINLNPEKLKQQQEENGRYEQWMKDHPEIEIPKESRRECGPEIAEFERMLVSFESAYSIEELSSIVDLTPQEASKHPVREPARTALVPIAAMWNALEEETDISLEKLKELYAKYMRLSRAVGIINSNKVDHGRIGRIF